MASSGTAPVIEEVDMVVAYKIAAVAEPDIVGDVEKERFWGLTGFLKERKRLRTNWRIGRVRKPERKEKREKRKEKKKRKKKRKRKYL